MAIDLKGFFSPQFISPPCDLEKCDLFIDIWYQNCVQALAEFFLFCFWELNKENV